MKETGFAYLPNTMEFFSKGIIFDQQFSVSEFTYPSLATIETGRYPQHSQIFNEEFSGCLAKERRTLSEQMKTLGYYCVNVMGDGGGIYNGTTGGYDRLIIGNSLLAARGVERTLKHIRAFEECDQFLFLHLGNTHIVTAHRHTPPLAVQTKTPLHQRLDERVFAPSRSSVFVPYAPLYVQIANEGVQDTDRHLACLYDYISRNYDEDEYIVQLYSDHGSSCYDREDHFLGDYRFHCAYMLRGKGVPALGEVDELTSTADIYPILGHLAGFRVPDDIDGNLPAVFGGEKRSHVMSNSIFPGQTYKLCLRTPEYECRLESQNPVEEDGTADLAGAKVEIRSRKGEKLGVEKQQLLWDTVFHHLVTYHTASIHNKGHVWPKMEDVSL